MAGVCTEGGLRGFILRLRYCTHGQEIVSTGGGGGGRGGACEAFWDWSLASTLYSSSNSLYFCSKGLSPVQTAVTSNDIPGRRKGKGYRAKGWRGEHNIYWYSSVCIIKFIHQKYILNEASVSVRAVPASSRL